MNKIQEQDIFDFSQHFSLRDEIKGKTFFITGSTGLIGSSLIRCLLALHENIKIITVVRDIRKFHQLFNSPFIEAYEGNLEDFDYNHIGDIDYIIHCAAPTSSKFFVDYPVETANSIYLITNKLLELARFRQIKSFVYLSSLEVYGAIHNEESITENYQGYINPIDVRSSYPMTKRAAECLCHLYAKEYHIPVKIARLTQTTGAGIANNDNRVIAQFARNAAFGRDIVLHTTGESARPYCYLTDAVSAIIYILLKGKDGEAYNVANEDTYISAKGLAEFLKEHFNPNIQIKIELSDNYGYAPTTKQKLATEKLRKLGWKPRFNLEMILERLIAYLKEESIYDRN